MYSVVRPVHGLEPSTVARAPMSHYSPELYISCDFAISNAPTRDRRLTADRVAVSDFFVKTEHKPLHEYLEHVACRFMDMVMGMAHATSQ